LNAATRSTYKKITGKDHFLTVVEQMKSTIERGAFVGWSFVVSPDNVHEIDQARALAKEIGVKYIQFKPAYINGELFKFDDIYSRSDDNTIYTKRYKQHSSLPCDIAHLVGIVGADANVYYCCQHRGDKIYSLGSLKEKSFEEIWKKRLDWFVDWTKCPHCRYMNYAKEYEAFINHNDLFFSHRYFL